MKDCLGQEMKEGDRVAIQVGLYCGCTGVIKRIAGEEVYVQLDVAFPYTPDQVTKCPAPVNNSE